MNGCPEEQRSRQILCSHLQHDKAEHRPRPGWCIHEGLRLPGTALSPSAYLNSSLGAGISITQKSESS